MNILVIHQYYLRKSDPGGSRFNQFAKYWTGKGDRVTVIAGTVHYATGRQAEKYRARWIVEEKEGERLKVLRTHVSEEYNRSFLGRLWAYLTFVVSSSWAGLFRAGRQDLVLASSPPLFVAIPGYLISRIKRIPLVFEIRDLWPESAIELGILRPKTAIKMAFSFERFILKKALVVNVLSPAFRDVLVKKGVPLEKIALIPNGADLDLLAPTDKNNWVREKYGWGDKFVVLYIGAHGVANHLIQVIDAAEELKDHEDIMFVLIGDGMEKPRLAAEARARSLKNIQFIDAQPKSEIASFVNAADACAAVLKKVETFKTVYPNKVFDYMSCAKPVISVIDGACRRLIEDAQAGIYVEPENITEFRQAVLRLKNDRGLCDQYGRNGRAYVIARFSREKLADQYASILRALVAGAPTR